MPTTTPYDCDLPAITIIQEKTRRARKTHKCSVCGFPISPKEKYNYFFVRDDESLVPTTYSWYQHVWCPHDGE